jgi:Ino eighty subunit 2
MEDEDEDDDDELSDLQSGDEDLPGAEDDEEELDSDLEGEDGDMTLDLTKLTRRQRAVYDEEQDASLMALSNEAQKKKHLTAEEHAMRRAEMARRRKNLSEKRNEEEKVRLDFTATMCFG